MIKNAVPILVSVILIGTANLTAYADDTLDKDYIVNEIWSDWWHGKGDDDYEWSEIRELQYSFRNYYKDLMDEWDFNDNRDGNWTIVTDETTYHFNFTKENFENMYQQYHGLGGNGVMTQLHADFMELPTEKENNT